MAPLGSRLSTISALLSLSFWVTFDSGDGLTLTISFKYAPTPSKTGPFRTGTFNLGTSANFRVLLGGANMAFDRSFPTLRSSMSKAHTNSMSRGLYPLR